MLTIDPKNTPIADVHQYLLGAVAPRPICFASTISTDGIPNLAPYSFFNVFSSNPPTAIFSSNRKVGDNSTKDTLANVLSQKEVVINVVNYDIVRQMTVASISYPPEVSEFEKAGLTPIPSDLVKPFRVKESPVQMECKVKQVVKLGEKNGAGNLILCDIIRIHISETVLDRDRKIDPHKIDLMGRMGRSFYCRASGDAIHKIYQPVTILGIGADRLPEAVRYSKVLTGNDIGKLAALPQLPGDDMIEAVQKGADYMSYMSSFQLGGENALTMAKHTFAKMLIAEGKVEEALAVLL